MPKQHGAWAMLAVPVAVGAVLTGPDVRHALLLVTWLVAYLAFHAAGLWLKASRRPRYLPPVRAYGALTGILGVALVASAPSLLWWAPAYGVLLAASLVCSHRRADRSWLNDGVTVVAAMLMTVVAAGLGAAGPLPGADDPRAWAATGLLAAYFLGTVPYVKSLIRDRDDPRVLAVSVVFHAVLLVGAVAGVVLAAVPGTDGESGVGGLGLDLGGAVLLVAVAAALLARAVLVPRRRPWPSAKAIGLGETAATVVVMAVVLAVV